MITLASTVSWISTSGATLTGRVVEVVPPSTKPTLFRMPGVAGLRGHESYVVEVASVYYWPPAWKLDAIGARVNAALVERFGSIPRVMPNAVRDEIAAALGLTPAQVTAAKEDVLRPARAQHRRTISVSRAAHARLVAAAQDVGLALSALTERDIATFLNGDPVQRDAKVAEMRRGKK